MSMQPLIDADILVYEVAFAGQYKHEETGETIIRDFDYVKTVLDNKIEQICDAVWATEDPILFLTGKGNFREDVAVSRPYKGTRDHGTRPFHYNNLRKYMEFAYDTRMIDGMEADDAMCIEQTSRL